MTSFRGTSLLINRYPSPPKEIGRPERRPTQVSTAILLRRRDVRWIVSRVAVGIAATGNRGAVGNRIPTDADGHGYGQCDRRVAGAGSECVATRASKRSQV